MKRIEFIAPIESMRGNLSETQKNIVYPTHDNRAYDGPVGERNTARNYNPILIGAKTQHGKTYFSVKTKTTNHLTVRAKHAMALMGGAASIYAAMLKDEAINNKLDLIYLAMLASGWLNGRTKRQIFMPRIMDALRSKSPVIEITFTGSVSGTISLTVNNPFVFGGQGSNVNVPIAIIEKFFAQLNPNPIFFKLVVDNGDEHIVINDNMFAQSGMTWQEYITDSGWCKENLAIYYGYIFGVFDGMEGNLMYNDSSVEATDYVNTGTYSLDFGG